MLSFLSLKDSLHSFIPFIPPAIKSRPTTVLIQKHVSWLKFTHCFPSETLTLCLFLRVVEQAADRVFMAARLFVRFFNQRGASLQQRILELLALADAADNFHKKTVTASVGGGLASVAGSITTITGLILAPFTAGTSLIVTAVGIGIATAGGVTSASANITDTVHSKTDRKKVEKMIQDYQGEIKDIKECLEFLQVRTYQEGNKQDGWLTSRAGYRHVFLQLIQI